jgi:hypothetical protein
VTLIEELDTDVTAINMTSRDHSSWTHGTQNAKQKKGLILILRIVFCLNRTNCEAPKMVHVLGPLLGTGLHHTTKLDTLHLLSAVTPCRQRAKRLRNCTDADTDNDTILILILIRILIMIMIH